MNDALVVFLAGVEVVIVGIEPSLFEPRGLGVVQHSQCDTSLEAHALHAAHHVDNLVEGRAVLHLAPRRSHAEACRAQAPGCLRFA